MQMTEGRALTLAAAREDSKEARSREAGPPSTLPDIVHARKTRSEGREQRDPSPLAISPMKLLG